MAFDRVVGQHRVKDILASSLSRNRLAHAYLFHGQAGVGKDAVALSVAMGFSCANKAVGGCGECSPCASIMNLEHPGFHLVLPVPSRPKSMKEDKYREILRERALQRIKNPYKEITYSPELSTLPIIGIDHVRAMKRNVMLKMAGGRQRIFFISHADRLNAEASNSLLKLLEEPPQNTILILTTSMPGRLLETIVSRCQAVRFDPLEEKQIENAMVEIWDYPRDQAKFSARLAGGSLQRALNLIDEGFEEKRNAAQAFLEISLEGSILRRVECVDDLVKPGNKQGVQETLRILEVWIRDLLYIDLGLPERIMNINREDYLLGFRERWPEFNAEAGMKCVEQAIDFIEKNVYLNLVVFSLSRELRGCANSNL